MDIRIVILIALIIFILMKMIFIHVLIAPIVQQNIIYLSLRLVNALNHVLIPLDINMNSDKNVIVIALVILLSGMLLLGESMLIPLVLFIALWSLPPSLAALAIFAADPFSKMLAGQLVQMMPYARSENEAKSGVVYRKISIPSSVCLAFQGLLPAIPLLLYGGINAHLEFVVFIPCIVMYFLYLKIWHTLRGYTGDCCGAMFLLVELSVYLTICIIHHLTLAAS